MREGVVAISAVSDSVVVGVLAARGSCEASLGQCPDELEACNQRSYVATEI